ncbi:hypothetical protein JW707_02245, partial [Candidatus Woesearchaeota archaeon]|nr:hypothetical protein [Candidatus Woesearchaeota archaeon]
MSAGETTFSRLERLCSNAKLRLQSNTGKMAKVVDHHEFDPKLRHFFEFFGDDPSAVYKEVHSVYSAMRDFRQGFNQATGITTAKKKYIIAHLFPELLLGILVGENESTLLEKKRLELTENIGPKEDDAVRKSIYDLRHTLFLHEDFALSGIRRDPHARFDLAGKLVENAEYCSKNSIFSEGYYHSSSFHVSVSSAYLTKVFTSLWAKDMVFDYEYLDDFISAMGTVVAAARKEGYIGGGLRDRCFSMCESLAKELRKLNIRDYRVYRGQIYDISECLE